MEDDIGVAIEQSERNKELRAGDFVDRRPTRCGSDFAGVVGGDATRHAGPHQDGVECGFAFRWVEPAVEISRRGGHLNGSGPSSGARRWWKHEKLGRRMTGSRPSRNASWNCNAMASVTRGWVIGRPGRWFNNTSSRRSSGSHGPCRTVHPWRVATLAVIERTVDYAGLPPAQWESLQDLRARVDAGEFVEPFTDRKDRVVFALGRIVGIGQFEQMIEG